MADAPLWTFEEIVAATGGTASGVPNAPLNGVAIDSRSLVRGDVFVAIKGDVHDGHTFAAAALKAGAGLAIVNEATREMKQAGAVLAVGRDPLGALEDMGRASRIRSSAKIIAITGSVGKTSTKDMLRSALSACGATHASTASFNNHWGVPLTLARMPRTAAYGIFEIGMNHAGEITPLVAMVRPHVAVITSIAASHLGHFASLAEIADAKAEIFSGIVPDGVAVLPRDSAYYDQLKRIADMRGVARTVSFGQHEQADVRLEKLALHPDCCCITARILDERVTYKLGLAGEHMALNSLAVLAAAKLAGADMTRASLVLADARPAKGRGVQETLKMTGGSSLLIDESYNANPESMRAALRLLAQARKSNGGRRIAVLGDMLELGQFSERLHAELAPAIAAADVNLLFASGPQMKVLWDAVPGPVRAAYAEKSSDLTEAILAAVRPGDVIMIKGSLGSRMEPLADALRDRYGAGRKD